MQCNTRAVALTFDDGPCTAVKLSVRGGSGNDGGRNFMFFAAATALWPAAV